MTREFWVWRFADGELNEQPFGSLAECERDAIGYDGHPVQLVPIGDAAKYLKEGETVAECIERNRRDADAAVELLRKALEKLEEAQKELAKLRAEVDKLQMQLVRQQASYEAEIKIEIEAATAVERERCAKIVAEELLLPKSAYAIRKERMTIGNPPITLEQFRAIAHRTATTYRHRSDPERSSYAFVDGTSLDDFWRAVCKAIQEQNE